MMSECVTSRLIKTLPLNKTANVNTFQTLFYEAKLEEIIIYSTHALQFILSNCKAGLFKTMTLHSNQ